MSDTSYRHEAAENEDTQARVIPLRPVRTLSPQEAASAFTTPMQTEDGPRILADLPARRGTRQRLMSSAAFVSDWKPPDPLINGVFQRRYIYAMTAKAGDGKTAICLTLALHVALGKVLGEHDAKQGRVLYFAGENPDDIRTRWMLLCEAYGVDPAALPVDFAAGACGIGRLIREAHKRAALVGGYALVIVDTAAAYFDEEDENSNTNMKDYAQELRKLTGLAGGPCVIVACHPVKGGGEEPRGGSAFLNEIDGNTYLDKRRGGLVTLERHWKFRGSEFDPLPFKLVQIVSERLTDGDGCPVVSVRAKPLAGPPPREPEEDALENALLDALIDNPERPLSYYAEQIGLSDPKGAGKNKAGRILDKLRDKGWAMKDDGKWRATREGEEAAVPERSFTP